MSVGPGHVGPGWVVWGRVAIFRRPKYRAAVRQKEIVLADLFSPSPTFAQDCGLQRARELAAPESQHDRHFGPSDSTRQAQKRRRLRTSTQASHGKLSSVGQLESRRTRFAADVGVLGMSLQALRSRLVPSNLNSLRVNLSFAIILWQAVTASAL